MSRIEITDATGVTQLAGDAQFPDGITVTDVVTPDVTSGASDPITIQTGDTTDTAADAGNITIRGGDGGSVSGLGGSITIQPGDGDSLGSIFLNDKTGASVMVVTGAGAWGVFGSSDQQQTVTGQLSAVVDANAKDVLTSIIGALTSYGLAIDGTT